MGYSKGREFTDEELIAEARKYKTKSELKAKDDSLLQIARRRGIPTSKLFEHMTEVSFSIPQLMCKLILETILEEKCLYNSRQIIKPYELDIYFEKYKLAIEYNGDYWHNNLEAKQRDVIKQQICTENCISLIVINMKSRRWEEDIKNQIIENLDIINKITNKKITAVDITKIDCKEVYSNLPAIVDLTDINEKINKCTSISEFAEKYKREYRYLRKSKQTHLLNKLRKKLNHPTNYEELIKACKQISSYSEFTSNHFYLYSLCHKLGILNDVTKHMKRTTSKYRAYSDDELINLAPKNLTNVTSFVRQNAPLYKELRRRNLLEKCKIPCPRKKAKHFARNLQYFEQNIIPLIESGLTLNKIFSNKLLPLSYPLLCDLLEQFGTDKIKEKLKQNKSNNYKNKKKN